ncbi:coiled-coil domain-containing protein [Leucobacter celer]|uniref:hypothetical protein n=1 Tax=Leucobacter celer TaxID=668625 RepID=UPI000ADDCF82|nr:hypothetical protein [Leucobacter celer]
MNAELQKGLRIRHLRLFGTIANPRTYDVSFLEGDLTKPIGVIAGASQTGKTSVIEYVQYLLGSDDYPDHEEMRDNVTSAALEISLNGEIHTIQRTTVGASSKFASVWNAPINGVQDAIERRLQIDKPGEEDSLSYFLMEAIGLSGVRLQTSAANPNADSHAFSFRDLSRLIFFENSRLDSKNLLVEGGNSVVAYKLQQTLDFVFQVSDEELGLATQRLRKAEEALREAESTVQALTAVVDKEYPEGPAGVEILFEDARRRQSALAETVRANDKLQAGTQSGLVELRNRLNDAQSAESAAWEKVRARESLVERLRALALQYADDRRKLTFLTEAERVFDPLRIETCPACLSKLKEPVRFDHGHCSLCGNEDASEQTSVSMLSKRELRAVTQRLDELTDYLGRLERQLSSMRNHARVTQASVEQLAKELNHAADLPAPFLAFRDQAMRDFSEAQSELARIEVGVRLWGRVNEAEHQRDLRQAAVTRLRREQRRLSARPNRDEVKRALSQRFAEILTDFGYPKLKGDAWLDDKLIPHVRGALYTKASSGGLVLISLAWAMAIWEISWEREALLPGVLVIDSPQKNLGHRASPEDRDFADARLVDNVYAHAATWLSGQGQGAQLVLVDNSPPQHVNTLVRYSGDRDVKPFGLIDDAVE